MDAAAIAPERPLRAFFSAFLWVTCLGVAGATAWGELAGTGWYEPRPLGSWAVAAGAVGVLLAWGLMGGTPGTRPRWTLVLFAAAILLMTADTTGLGIFPFFLATFALPLDRPLRPAILTWVTGVALYSAAAAAWGDAPLLVLGTVLTIILGWSTLSFSFGLVLRQSQDAHRRATTALAALERSHADLSAAHADLARRGRELRELALQRELQRTAGELHDGLGHRLTAIGMALDVGTALRASDAARAWEHIGEARTLTGNALQDLRHWVRAVGAPRPVELWGPDAVASIVDTFGTTDLAVGLTVTGTPVPLDDEREVVLFRVVQEGLTNAVRHGGAHRVGIALDYTDAALDVRVTDDGCGSDDPDAAASGFGLRALAARVAELGGVLTAGGVPDGFEVQLTVPTREAA